MEGGPRLGFVLFVLLFFLLSPDTQQPTPAQRRELGRRVDEEQHAFGLLNSSRYGDFNSSADRWLQVSGMRKDDGFAWNLLPFAQNKAKDQLSGFMRQAGITLPADESLASAGRLSEPPVSNSTFSNLPIPVYNNVTGKIRGQWVRSNLPARLDSPHLNLTSLVPENSYVTHDFSRNVTGNDGKLRIDLSERKGDSLRTGAGYVREISAEMTIKTDTSPGSGWELTLHGVHYSGSGGILLTTTSEKFSGIFSLPHFSLSQQTFDLSRALLNSSLSAILSQQEESLSSIPAFPWSSSPNSPGEALFPTPSCEFIVYLQQHPVVFDRFQIPHPAQDSYLLQTIESELRFPTGAPLPEIPQLVMSAVIFSPDCGFVLESRGPPEYSASESLHLNGPKLEAYHTLARRLVLAFVTILGMQISLMMRQMRDASTPSTKSRISFYAIAMMSMGDGFAWALFFALGTFADSSFLIFISAAFLSFFGMGFLGMRFLMDIWTIQAPERRERERQSASSNVQSPSQNNGPLPPTTPSNLPLPATAPRPNDTGATPIIMPSDQDLGVAGTGETNAAQNGLQTLGNNAVSESGALYSRFYFSLLGLVSMSLWAWSWPSFLRSLYINTLAFSYLSFWTPQIYRNVMRNCRKALRWEFVVGQSLLRLAPFVYFYTVPGNILFVETDTNAAFALVGWVWIQVWALVSQELLGPRFFVRSSWVPPAYDYHPVLRDDDLESGATMPVGFIQSEEKGPVSPTTGRYKDKGNKTFDCAICMQNIEVPVVSGTGASSETTGSIATSILGRRSYMVTPCRHIFHSTCLEGWMRLRLQCPICREPLPPL